MSDNIGHKNENSKSPARTGNRDRIEASRVIDGVAKEEKEYAFSAVAASDKPGNTVGTHVRKGGVLHVVNKGGTEIIGGTAEDRERLARIQAEVQKEKIAAEAEQNLNKVKVSVKYPNYTGRHEGKYHLDQPLFDVIVDICKKEQDKKVKHIKNENNDVVHENTKISDLQNKGLLESLTVVFQ